MINVTLYSGYSEKLFDICNRLTIQPVELTAYATSVRFVYTPLCDEEIKEKLDSLFEEFKGTEINLATNSDYVILYFRLLHKQKKIKLNFIWFTKEEETHVAINEEGKLDKTITLMRAPIMELYSELL